MARKLKVRCAAPGTIEDIRIKDESPSERWLVTVFDNDQNTFDEVMIILMVATSCEAEEASMETWEIHHLGKSMVHMGGEEECHDVAEIIATIGIRVEVTEE